MSKSAVILMGLACALRAEIRPMNLRQAVETALKQNPDIALARLDEEKARQAVRVAKDPFLPRVVVGSGLAYTYGFPMSMEGSAPSVLQANATQYVFNRPQSYLVAQAKEDVRGASLAVTSKRDEIAYRTAALYLDAERAARVGAVASKDAESLGKVLEAAEAQVREGRALPVTQKQAEFNLARARQIAASLEDEQASAETALALALGFQAEDRVRPVEQTRPVPEMPATEEAAVKAALESNAELRRLESQILSKGFAIRGQKAQRLPRADLIAQYGMFAKFNNYEEYFGRFQRNNGQIGVSFQLPLFTGAGIAAQTSQTQADVSKLKIDLTTARNRIQSDLQQSFRDVKRAESAADVARLDLELARDQLSVNLALMQEGRMTLREVEQSRVLENAKWIAFYDARYTVEKAKWNVLRLTGQLLASVQALP